MNAIDDRYISVSDVKKFLGMTNTSTVTAWLTEYGAKVIQVKQGSKTTTRVWKPDVDRFIEEHTVKPEPKPEPKRRGRPPKLQLAK